ncbi:hypothetical protein [Pirellulimonas nuda]|uniref:hypothetical protein n=1 Tax=Pirellulimonas nuda TaxID=2528009 RepID=UPI0018D46C12|nr:hypothetical protein [Pirellulimonas nuda]
MPKDRPASGGRLASSGRGVLSLANDVVTTAATNVAFEPPADATGRCRAAAEQRLAH